MHSAVRRIFARSSVRPARGNVIRANEVLNSFMLTSTSHQPNRTIQLSASTLAISDKDFPSNALLMPAFVNNRNPRNLERLRIANKPDGWWLDKPGRCFWNKVSLEITSRHVIGKVEHFEGQVPVIASTKEWSIKKFLYSTKDVSAVEAVGKVLARRCLEVGLIELYCNYTEEDRRKEKISLFLKALEDGGINLIEPVQLQMPFNLNYPFIPEKAWEVHEEIDDEIELDEDEDEDFRKS